MSETTKHKIFGYSYPTSPNAVHFKKPQGCWTVGTKEHVNAIPEYIAAFDTREEAKEYADSLPYPYDYFTNKYELKGLGQ